MSKPIPQHQLTTDSAVRSGADQPMHLALRAMRKVPEITAIFWIIKLLSTAMGESTTDYLVYQINPYVAVALGCIGTAAGDMTASTLRLGYFASFVLFAVLFALPGLAYWLFGLNEIGAFWFAYIMTRPLGASFADWLGKPYLGGLGLNDGKVALVLTILIIGFVGYLTVTRKDIKGEQH